MKLGVRVAVSVYGNYAVRVFCNDFTVRIHAEGSYKVAVFLRAVDYLALIDLLCDMLKNSRREFNSYADVNTVASCFDAEFVAYARYPL